MASFHTQSVRCLSVSARLMRKPNIQRPIVPSTERRLLDAVTVPVFPPDTRPSPLRCLEQVELKRQDRKSELSEAYEAFRLKQAKKVFSENKMVAVCHALPMASKEFMALRTKMKAVNLSLVSIRNDVAVKACENTKFQNLLPFFTSTNIFAVSEEIRIVELVKELKKNSDLHLLGGLMEDRILTRDAMMDLAKLPSLDVLRGELLTILKAPAVKTSGLLVSHQLELTRCLQQLSTQTGQEDLGTQA